METQKIGQMIKEARQKKGLTQEQVGAYVGYTRSMVSQIESSEAYPAYDALMIIAGRLDLDFDKLKEFYNAERIDKSNQRQERRLRRFESNIPIIRAGVDSKNASNNLSMVQVPIITNTAVNSAEDLIIMRDSATEFISVEDSDLIDTQGLVAISANGNAMCENGIVENDILIIDTKSELANGSLVLAVIDKNPVIRAYNKSNYITLHSTNPAYPPIVLDNNKDIVGKVVKLMRNF